MKIIVVGVGKVGRTITSLLSQEAHDITIIDENPKLVDEIVNLYDCLGVVGNGASHEVLLAAGVDKAQLLIAATSSDEVNILSCLVSKRYGVEYTIARVRDPEYSKQVDFFHDELGINMIVNPELETANEITKLLRFPSALTMESFAKGRVEIAEMMVLPNSPLVGKQLKDLPKIIDGKYLICIVERDGVAYIPDGNFTINANDKIHVNASMNDLSKFFKKTGNLMTKAKNVIIIGGGKISYYLALKLTTLGVKVKIIEQDKERCRELVEALPDVMIVSGAGSDHELLMEEGIEFTDALVALTGYDEDNIIISLYAKAQGVKKVITKINYYNNSKILSSINLDSITSTKEVIANHIIRYVRSLENALGNEVKTLYKLVNNQVEAMEFYIQKEAAYTNVKFKDLTLRPNILIASIIRDNKVIIPSGNDFMKPGDSVIIVSTQGCLTNLEEILA